MSTERIKGREKSQNFQPNSTQFIFFIFEISFFKKKKKTYGERPERKLKIWWKTV